MTDLFDDNNSGAAFSADRKYRYCLHRIWDADRPRVMFIGLNPSTAAENKNDPTIRRVIRFARDWGYGGVYMMNLFALVSPYPVDLLVSPDPVGENDIWLRRHKELVGEVVFAWGSFSEGAARALVVIDMFPGAKCLQMNKNGAPRHPLYVPANQPPVPFDYATARTELVKRPIKQRTHHTK